jgi:O-antigen ligase
VRRLLENVAPRAWILLVAWIAISMALLLTHSRGGFISTYLGLLMLCLTLALTGQVKLRFAVFVTGLVIVGGTFFFALAGDVTDQRLASVLLQREERPRVYELTLQAIEAAPLLGTGYGTFEEVFRFYRDPSLNNFYESAHNTYLENTLELGLPGAAALFLTIGGLSILTLLGVLRRRRDAIFPCIGFAATTLVASHSLVDFSLQVPAVALTYSLLMGTACAQSFSTRKRANSGGG